MFIIPFHIKNTPIRGRYVRIESIPTTISNRYPLIINKLLIELSLMSLLTSYCFKFNGRFTLQITSTGPVKLAVVDIHNDTGLIRLCCRFDEETLPQLNDTHRSIPIHQLFKNGNLAFTIDPQESIDNVNQRYQGIVELQGETLSECMHYFFRQSEQLDTGIVIASEHKPLNDNPNNFMGAGIMIQKLPVNVGDENAHETWVDYMAYLGTLKPDEMIQKDGHDILNRLFWEKGVISETPISVNFGCTCSREKIKDMLNGFNQTDRDHIQNQSSLIEVECEFCGTIHVIEENELTPAIS
jgi:molecular chaperone Hsp33